MSKTKEEIFCEHLGEYVPCEKKNVVLTYIESDVILIAMESYALQQSESAVREYRERLKAAFEEFGQDTPWTWNGIEETIDSTKITPPQ